MWLRGNRGQKKEAKEEDKFTLEGIKNSILSIEELYTDHSLQF